MKRFVPAIRSLMLLLLIVTPSMLFAQGLVTCHEPGTCSFCKLLAMINEIMRWLIITATLATFLIIAYAGFLLIFSQGNAAALKQGKQIFYQSLIGILIMLAGWTIVDTVIKLVTGSDFGMWNQVECATGEYPVGVADYTIRLEREIGVIEGTVLETEDGDMESCDTSQIVSTSFLGHSIQIHQSLVGRLQAIDAIWRQNGGNGEYAIHSVGGYACRNVAGSNRRSYHSYGVAIDVNPSANPHRFDGVCQTDMPDWFVNAFTSNGFGWGCNWNSSKDAMHFSAASGEGGNINIRR